MIAELVLVLQDLVVATSPVAMVDGIPVGTALALALVEDIVIGAHLAATKTIMTAVVTVPHPEAVPQLMITHHLAVVVSMILIVETTLPLTHMSTAMADHLQETMLLEIILQETLVMPIMIVVAIGKLAIYHQL